MMAIQYGKLALSPVVSLRYQVMVIQYFKGNLVLRFPMVPLRPLSLGNQYVMTVFRYGKGNLALRSMAVPLHQHVVMVFQIAGAIEELGLGIAGPPLHCVLVRRVRCRPLR